MKEYEFQISPYSNSTYVQQVSHALERRTESISRTQYPRIWKITDYFNSKKVSDVVLRKRKFRYKIYGIALIIMGIFLFVPGAMEPQKLTVPLVAGILGILVGVFTLWNSRTQKHQSKRFEQAAEKLLKGLKIAPSVRVKFTEKGMKIADQQPIPYSDFDFVCETNDLFLFTRNEQIAILQKRDMVEGSNEQFTSFLENYIEIIPS